MDTRGILFKLLVSNLFGLLNFPVTHLCKSCFHFQLECSSLPAACLCHTCACCVAQVMPDHHCRALKADLPIRLPNFFIHSFQAMWAKRPSREAHGRKAVPHCSFSSPWAGSGCGVSWSAPGEALEVHHSRTFSSLLKFSPHAVCSSVDS